MAEINHGSAPSQGSQGSQSATGQTAVRPRNTAQTGVSMQTGDTVFSAVYDQVAAQSDCATFLTKPRSFSAATITIGLHPCFQKEGSKPKVVTIGCKTQNGEGVSITPKFNYKDIESQCPGTNQKRLESSELMVKIGLNENAFSTDELFAMMWALGSPEETQIDGVDYTRQAIGQVPETLPLYTITIRPITRDGQPSNGIFVFPQVQLISEGTNLSLGTKADNKGELMFNVLFDSNAGSMGWIYTLK